jgi:hypothetical protein
VTPTVIEPDFPALTGPKSSVFYYLLFIGAAKLLQVNFAPTQKPISSISKYKQ